MGKSKGPDQGQQLINLQAQQLAAQVGNWAATLDFQKERFRLLELPEFQAKNALEVDRLAWEKAQATYENAYKESLLTGYYQGQPTVSWLETQARLTGTLNGEMTLEGKLNEAQINDMQAKMKLANDEFLASTTGYNLDGSRTFDREKFEAAQASDAWKFIATLSGPSNAFRQARAIASTPGGVGDLMGAWAGQFGMASSTSVGSAGRPSFASLAEGFAADPSAVNGPQIGGARAPATGIPGYTYQPAGVQAPVSAWNYTPQVGGGMSVAPPGVSSDPNSPDISTTTPVSPQAAANVYQYGGAAAPPTGALLPNQINARNYENSYQYQKDLGWATFEDAGTDPALAQEAYKRSLPTWGGVSKGVVSF